MTRRSALMLSLLTGGLLPAAPLLAQDAPRRRAGGSSTTADDRPGFRRPSRLAGDIAADDIPSADAFEPGPDAGAEPDAEPAASAPAPPDFTAEEPGHVWKRIPIGRYTGLPHSSQTRNPQNAIVEWIFRRYGSGVWHGGKIAVLSATADELRAYHNPTVLRNVERMVERFTDQERTDILKLRVRFVAAADPRWRYAVFTQLQPKASGPQGQQVWTLGVEDAALVRTQLMVYQGFQPLAEETYEIINGQTFSMQTTKEVGYVVGPQRDGGIGLGFQPGTGRLQEGVTLRMSPLLNYEGDKLDAAIDLSATTVKRLLPTRILAPREVGPADMTIDVPEVTHSRLNQTILDWPLGQTLLISAGIQPGILLEKRGLLNLRIPGTVPTQTELLVFIDVEAVPTPARTARGRDRSGY